jgi:phage terminase large subunit-like protein
MWNYAGPDFLEAAMTRKPILVSSDGTMWKVESAGKILHRDPNALSALLTAVDAALRQQHRGNCGRAIAEVPRSVPCGNRDA